MLMGFGGFEVCFIKGFIGQCQLVGECVGEGIGFCYCLQGGALSRLVVFGAKFGVGFDSGFDVDRDSGLVGWF